MLDDLSAEIRPQDDLFRHVNGAWLERTEIPDDKARWGSFHLIAEQAEKRGGNPGQIYAQLEKSGRLKEMERSITEDKVFKWLVDRNDVSTNA